MSNYTKATNFATKDTLPTGDSGKIVKGTEIDNELNAIASAISSKADTASPTFTGTPAAPTATTGSNTTQLATTAFVTGAISDVLATIYPVGSIYTNASVSTNPGTLLGFGTWVSFGAGRVLVGLDGSNTAFDTLEETGGSADAINVAHTHTATSVVTDPGHTHTVWRSGLSANGGGAGAYGSEDSPTYASGSNTTGISVATTVASSGSSGTNANLQPYIVVYMWKRTA